MRVTSQKLRQLVVVQDSVLDPYILPENVALFNADGTPFVLPEGVGGDDTTMSWRGPWVENTDYSELDVVSYDPGDDPGIYIFNEDVVVSSYLFETYSPDDYLTEDSFPVSMVIDGSLPRTDNISGADNPFRAYAIKIAEDGQLHLLTAPVGGARDMYAVLFRLDVDGVTWTPVASGDDEAGSMHPAINTAVTVGVYLFVFAIFGGDDADRYGTSTLTLGGSNTAVFGTWDAAAFPVDSVTRLLTQGESFELPVGGDVDQLLAKASADDRDVIWVDPPDPEAELPLGGVTGEFLAKASELDGEVEWVPAPEGGTVELPAGGGIGEFLAKVSTDDGDVEWVPAPEGDGGGSGGTLGFEDDFATDTSAEYDTIGGPIFADGHVKAQHNIDMRARPKDFLIGDHYSVIKFNWEATVSHYWGYLLKWIDEGNRLDVLVAPNGVVTLTLREGGSGSGLTSGSFSPVANTDYWLLSWITADRAGFLVFNVDPETDSDAIALCRASASFNANRAGLMSLPAAIGIHSGNPTNTNGYFDSLKVVALNGMSGETAEDELPMGGATGEFLAKASATDGDVEWVPAPEVDAELPTGGATGDFLAKASATDGDVDWVPAPEGGGAGLVWAGIWSDIVDYIVNDVVNFEDKLWVAVKANTDSAPTTATGLIWTDNLGQVFPCDLFTSDSLTKRLEITAADQVPAENTRHVKMIALTLLTGGTVVIEADTVGTAWDGFAVLYNGATQASYVDYDDSSSGGGQPKITTTLAAGRYTYLFGGYTDGLYGTSDVTLTLSGGATLDDSGGPAWELLGEEPVWTDLTSVLATDWRRLSNSANYTVRTRKHNGIVRLEGHIERQNTSASDGTVMFTLPVGLRPIKPILGLFGFMRNGGSNTNGWCALDIATNGEVSIRATSFTPVADTWFTLGGISWPIT